MKQENTTPTTGRIQYCVTIAMLLAGFLVASHFLPHPVREIPLTTVQLAATFIGNSCIWAAWYLAGRRHGEKTAQAK